VKLTPEDRELLLSWGHDEKDIQQIEEATHSNKTSYDLDGTPIGREEAIRLLGRKEYLSGISRSAFHGTSVRWTDDGKEVFFDSSRLFR
jgi:hypothetical protein